MVSRILIISTNNELAPQPVAPLGAAWVSEALTHAGFDVRLLDLSFEKDPEKKVGSVLKSFQPEGVGISVRNVDNGDFLCPKSYLPHVKDLTGFIKENTDARILIGGSGVSIMPEQILDYLGLDYAIVGEGEEAAVKFFKADAHDDLEIPGLVRRGGYSYLQDRAGWLSTADLLQPRLHRWVDIRRYLRYEPVLPVQGKRGCANNCLYCTYNRIEGRTYRLREPAAVAEEISNTMLKTSARTFEFVDSIFNQPEGYMELLLEEIIKWDLKARFHVSSMSPRGLTHDQVRLMERAGITAVGITPESASDETLASLRKGFTERDVHRAADLLKLTNIKALWCFLLGGPEEDAATLGKTVNFINKKISRKDKAFITTGVRIYPRTGMHDLAIREGVVSRDESLMMPRFYFTSKVSPEEARNTLRTGLDSLGQAIFLSDTQFSNLGFLRRAGTALHIPSPFWSYAGYMNLMLSNNRVVNRAWGR